MPWLEILDMSHLPRVLKTLIIEDDGDLCSSALDLLFRQFNQVGGSGGCSVGYLGFSRVEKGDRLFFFLGLYENGDRLCVF